MAFTLLQIKSLFQDPMRMGIVDVLWKSSRVMNLLNFIPFTGLAYPYAEGAQLPGISFRGLNETFTPTRGIYNPKVESLAILGGRIQTDSIAIQMKGPAARTREITRQIEAAAKFWDKNFFIGDAQVNPKGFT
jgi:hypothetical protein